MIDNNKKKLKAAIVTGATSGFGLELIKKLIKNYYVIFTSRSIDNVEKTINSIIKVKNQNIKFFVCDFEMFESVKNVANNISDFINKFNIEVDLIIHNVGQVKGDKHITKDGFLSEIQVNAYSTILFNELLYKCIDKRLCKTCTIVFIVSTMYKIANFNLSYDKDDFYDPVIAYANSKFIEIYYCLDFFDRIKKNLENLEYENNIKIVLYSPGYVKTKLLKNLKINKFHDFFYLLLLRKPENVVTKLLKILKIEQKKEFQLSLDYIWLRIIKIKIDKNIIKNKINNKIIKDLANFINN